MTVNWGLSYDVNVNWGLSSDVNANWGLSSDVTVNWGLSSDVNASVSCDLCEHMFAMWICIHKPVL